MGEDRRSPVDGRTLLTGIAMRVDEPHDLAELQVGDRYTCAVDGERNVWCWGVSTLLRPGSLLGPATRFGMVPLIADARGLSAGSLVACVLQENAVWCWGSAAQGLLDGSPEGVAFTARSAAAVPTTEGALDVGVGTLMACAVMSDQHVRCWGRDAVGLGDGSADLADVRFADVSGVDDAVDVEVGNRHACVLRADGSVWCWGNDDEGQTGCGVDCAAERQLSPVPVVGLSNAVSLHVGADHACAIDATGDLYCWGQNSTGQLGVGSPEPFLPYASRVDLEGVVTVAAGGGFTCAATQTESYCWGFGAEYQLGDGRSQHDGVATDRPRLLSALAWPLRFALGAGTCVLPQDGFLRCTGGYAFSSGATPAPWPAAGTGIRDVSSFGDAICAIDGEAVMRCDGPRVAVPPSPGPVDEWRVEEVSLQLNGGCVLRDRAEGTPRIACWRFPSGLHGEWSRLTGRNASSLVTGHAHACVLDDAEVLCWGKNTWGQIGTGTRTQSNVPLPVDTLPEDDRPVRLAAGGNTTCTVTEGGALYCWGRGIGDTVGGAPAPVRGLGTVLDVAIGQSGEWACARIVTGDVVCWGANDEGQLGDGTTTDRGTPDIVAGLSDAAYIECGQRCCAVRTSGQAVCWGPGTNGALADACEGASCPTFHALPTPVADLLGP